MLDTYPHDPKRSADWQEHLSWGDIVSFRFPILNNPIAGCGPKNRPCLVIDRTTIGALPFVTIAYGTTQDGRKTRGYDLAVTSQTGILTAGLHKPTRFCCCRHIRVPLNHNGFVWLAKNKSPVIGTLHGEDFDLMNRIRARLHANADIVADRRQRRRFYGRRPNQPRSFEVGNSHITNAI